MKVYSIGREAGCDIVINDHSDVVSRRHAVLNVYASGKMTIVDQSQNGTYVNGIRISSNVPVPVTRKDKVSFAHVARLDWNMVPKSSEFIVRKAAIVVAVLLVIGIGLWSGIEIFNAPKHTPEKIHLSTLDTLSRPKSEKEIRKEIQDSLTRAKAREDSITKAKAIEDSIKNAKIKKSKKRNKDAKPAKTNKDDSLKNTKAGKDKNKKRIRG